MQRSIFLSVFLLLNAPFYKIESAAKAIDKNIENVANIRFIEFVANDDLKNVKELLSSDSIYLKYIDINYVNNKGFTALMTAIKKENSEMIGFLLKQPGINPHIVNNRSESALTFAANAKPVIKELFLKLTNIQPDLEHKDAISSDVHDEQLALKLQEEEYLSSLAELPECMEDSQEDEVTRILAGKKRKDLRVSAQTNFLSEIAEAQIMGRSALPSTIELIEKNREFEEFTKKADKAFDNRFYRGSIDINVASSKGFTALMLAALTGDIDLLNWLLDKPNININAQNKFGDTAVMLAARFNNKACVDKLLEKKADINFVNKKGQSLVDILKKAETEIKYKHPTAQEESKYLLAGKLTKINDDPIKQAERKFIQAVSAGDMRTVNKLLSKRHNVYPININATNSNGSTVLMLAVKNADYMLTELLLKNPKINVNIQNKQGDTALIIAARAGAFHIASLLLNVGARVEITNNQDESFLTLNQEFGQEKSEQSEKELESKIEQKIEEKTEGDQDDGEQKSAPNKVSHISRFKRLVNQNRIELAIRLLNKDNINQIFSYFAKTANYNNDYNKKFITILLENGANINYSDLVNKHILFAIYDNIDNTASENGTFNPGQKEIELFQFLIDNGVDLDKAVDNIDRNSFLSYIVQIPSTLNEEFNKFTKNLARLLILNKANVNFQNSMGDTPLHILMSENASGDLELISILLENGARIDLTNNAGLTFFDYIDDPVAKEVIRTEYSNFIKSIEKSVYQLTPLPVQIIQIILQYLGYRFS